MSSALIVFYFLILLCTLLVTTKTVQGPWLFLFRAFFPNWKFYHSLGWQPQLFVRVRPSSSNNADLWGDSQLIYPRAQRSVLHLFHNPSVNIALAHQNLVEHLANDLQELSDLGDAKKLVSYQLVNRFVQYWINEHFSLVAQSLTASNTLQALSAGSVEYQFEIRLKLNSPEIKARLDRERSAGLDHHLHAQQSNLPEGEEVHVLMISPSMVLRQKQSDRANILPIK